MILSEFLTISNTKTFGQTVLFKIKNYNNLEILHNTSTHIFRYSSYTFCTHASILEMWVEIYGMVKFQDLAVVKFGVTNEAFVFLLKSTISAQGKLHEESASILKLEKSNLFVKKFILQVNFCCPEIKVNATSENLSLTLLLCIIGSLAACH